MTELEWEQFIRESEKERARNTGTPPIVMEGFDFMESLVEFLERDDHPPTKEMEDFLCHAFRIAPDISRGHEFGYSEKQIGGNIVMAKRALMHAEAAMKFLWDFRAKSPSMAVPKLFNACTRLQSSLTSWIDQLQHWSSRPKPDWFSN